jgi:membrane associated rhomboid family serine protease
MLLPLGDAPNPRGVPYVTYALIAINVAVYLFITLPLSDVAPDINDPVLAEYVQSARHWVPPGTSLRQLVEQTSEYDLIVFEHGYRPSEPRIASLFTAMFLHGGFMHLFGNMLFLWIYGDNVEHRIGRFWYLFWYLFTGALATLVHSLFSSSSPVPLVGASGAISGVLGFYFVWFPHNRVRLWFFLFPFFMNVVMVPARIVLGMFLVIDNFLPFLFSSAQGGGVAYGAHIGGFFAGMAAAWVIDRRGVTAQPEEFEEARAVTTPSTPAQQITQALLTGDERRAAEWYFALPADETPRVLSPRDSLTLARWLAEQRHGQAALVVYQRHLRDYPNGPGLAEAHLGAGLVQLYLLAQPAAAYQHLVESLEHDPDAVTEARAREAIADIVARQKFQVSRWQR